MHCICSNEKRTYQLDTRFSHICSDHFSANSYKGFGAKIAGFSSKLVLKKSAVPSIHASPTPEQVNEAQRRKRKLPLPNKQLKGEDLSLWSRRRRTPHHTGVCLLITANASMSTSSTNTCDSVLDELPDTRNDENEASSSVKKPVAELRSTANKCTQKGDRCPSCRSKGI